MKHEYLAILQVYIAEAQERQGASDVYQTADQVAAVVMQALQSGPPPIRVRTSQWAEEFIHLKTGLDPDGEKRQAMVMKQSFG